MAAASASLQTEVGVFGPDETEALAAFFVEHGFAVLRGLLDEERTARVQAECEAAQAALVAGELDPKHGTTALVDDADGRRTAEFANYVLHVTELSPACEGAVFDPVVRGLIAGWLGEGCWAAGQLYGFVYQDARPGRESSYTRIGWHSDWQSGPDLAVWPAVAITLHVDATSPENGFLRVVPGSHRWATPAPFRNVNGAEVPPGSAPAAGHTDQPPPFDMPLGFGKVPGELAVYCERGDVLFHDCYLWHSAARATDDEGVRRHVRGSFFGGTRPAADGTWTFVKNAAR